MLHLEYSTNPNGKLFNDTFSDIRLQSQALTTGAEMEIIYKGIFLGYGKIEATRHIHCGQLTNTDAFINCGKPAPYQLMLLSRYYNGGARLGDSEVISILIISYLARSDAQQSLMNDWWQKKFQTT